MNHHSIDEKDIRYIDIFCRVKIKKMNSYDDKNFNNISIECSTYFNKVRDDFELHKDISYINLFPRVKIIKIPGWDAENFNNSSTEYSAYFNKVRDDFELQLGKNNGGPGLRRTLIGQKCITTLCQKITIYGH